LGPPERAELDLDLELDGPRAQLRRLSARGLGLTLSARGRAALAGPATRLEIGVRADTAAPSRLLAALGVKRSGSIHLVATASGTLARPAVRARIEARALVMSAPPLALEAVDLPLRLSREGVLRIDHASARLAGGEIALQGSAALRDARGRWSRRPPFEAELQARQLELGELLRDTRPLSLSGTLCATAAIASATGAPFPSGRATVAVDRLGVGTATFSRARLAISARSGKARLERLELDPAAGGQIRGSGWATLLGEPILFARVEGVGLPVGLARELTGRSTLPALDGRLRFEAAAIGTIAAPNAAIELEARELVVGDVPRGTLRARASGGRDQIALHASLAAPGSRSRPLELDGSYRLAEHQVNARLAGGLDSLRGLGPTPKNLDARVEVDLAAEGRLPFPSVTGRLWVGDLTLAGERVPDGTALVLIGTSSRTGGHSLAVHAEAFHALKLDGELRASGERLSAELRARLDDLDPLLLVPRGARGDLKARLSGQAAVHYERGHRLVAALELSKLEAGVPGSSLHNTAPIVARLEGRTLRLEELALTGDSGTIHASAMVGPDTLLSRIDGQLELAFVSSLLPAVSRATGTARLDLSASGSLVSPHITGTLSLLTPVKLVPRGSFEEITLRSLSLELAPERVRLAQLAGEYAGGSFEAHGSVEFERSRSISNPDGYDLVLLAQSVPFRSADLELEGNAELHLLSAPTPLLRGRIEVLRGRYTRKFQLQSFNLIAGPRGPEPGPSESIARRFPFLGTLELRLHAVSAGALELDVDAGPLKVNLDLGADLSVLGTPASPIIGGRVVVERGTLSFPATKLDITEGSLVFPGAAGGKLSMSLRAEGDVQPGVSSFDSAQPSYLVNLALSGPPDKLALDINTVPYLSKMSGLALLITGHPSLADLAQSIGPAGGTASRLDSALVFAGSQLSAPIDRLLEQQLQQKLNLEVELGTQVTSEGVRITLSKEITPRIRLEGGYQRLFLLGESAATGGAQLLLSDRIFLAGLAQRTLSAGLTLTTVAEGRIELKLRLLE
jgi:hypothetical protein